MRVLLHRKPRGPQGIRSDAERERAAAQVDFLRAAIEKAGREKPTRRNADFIERCQAMVRQREAEIGDYDALKRGDLRVPKVNRVDELATFISRIRIANGVSQTELARRLGVSKQVINRYEESGYQTVGLARLQQILDALGAKVQIDLRSAS